jgi:glycerol-1-phosphate dehydrogenase [NAD(P)+]
MNPERVVAAMTKTKEYKIENLINKNIKCTCGKIHYAGIADIIIGKDAINRIPGLLAKYQCQNLFLVADENTYGVVGEKVEKLLREHGFNLSVHIFQREKPLVADERAIGELLIRLNKDTDMLIAVGSGTLNDLLKYISYKLHIPYIIVATAPSMDGYSSFVSPLIVGNLKITFEVTTPRAIIADIDILKKAPLNMLQAGLGDMLGKYTGLCDWELTKIINDEYYCNWVVGLVKKSIEKCINNLSGILERNEMAIASLTEGLILSGIAMNLIGNSRPASGSEHHLSHCWEIMFLLSGKEAILHGIKVGIATVAITKLFHMLKNRQKIDCTVALEKIGNFDKQEWTQKINQIFQVAAASIIAMEEDSMKNSIESHRKRIKIIEKKWFDIIKMIDQILPTTKTIEKILLDVKAPINPIQIDIDADTFYNSLIYGKEVRNRYGILQLLWDLGLLEEFSREIVDYFYQKKSYNITLSKNKEKNILKQAKCFILDMDGTFYVENKIIEGALSFIKKVKECGKTFYFFTNNSSKNARYYQDKLMKMGCPVQEKNILTSNQVILKYLTNNQKNKKIFLLGNSYLRDDFKSAGVKLVNDNPDLVVVGFDTSLQYQRVSRACHYIREGILFLAVNPDLNCPVEEGFIPDCGSICTMITTSTGIKPIVFGKPSPYTLQYILDFTGLEAADIAYIGDRLYTDIAMGKDNEMITILVLSGETRVEDIAGSGFQPDLIFKSLKEIKILLDEIY